MQMRLGHGCRRHYYMNPLMLLQQHINYAADRADHNANDFLEAAIRVQNMLVGRRDAFAHRDA